MRSYYSGNDRVTEIYAIDQAVLKERELKSKSYAKGTKASKILQDPISQVGIPVAVFAPKRDHTYKDKSTVDGGLMENIRKYAKRYAECQRTSVKGRYTPDTSWMVMAWILLYLRIPVY